MLRLFRRKRQPEASKQHTGGSLIELCSVTKTYVTPAGEFEALKTLDLSIEAGEFVAITGRSGSGKSTMINMLTGIDSPTTGEIYVSGQPIHALTEDAAADWRGQHVGIIFQFFQLLPLLTCIENVMLPMDFVGFGTSRSRRSRAQHLLELVDMGPHVDKLPTEVSGGQQQRVAIARALAADPQLIVADEPTGNLDSNTADAIFALFEQLVAEGKTIVMVTHDDELAQRASRIVRLADGVVVSDTRRTAFTEIETKLAEMA